MSRRSRLLVLVTSIFLSLSLALEERKSEALFNLFNGRGGGGGGGGGPISEEFESSEEDFPINKFQGHVIVEFFQHFKGSKRCGKLGRRILKKTQQLFHPAADRLQHISRRRLSHHLSRLYSRYASDCCDH